MKHRIHWLRRKGAHVWEIPFAETSLGRRTPWLPATNGRTPFESDYEFAWLTAQALNRQLRTLGLPGKFFTVGFVSTTIS